MADENKPIKNMNFKKHNVKETAGENCTTGFIVRVALITPTPGPLFLSWQPIVMYLLWSSLGPPYPKKN